MLGGPARAPRAVDAVKLTYRSSRTPDGVRLHELLQGDRVVASGTSEDAVLLQAGRLLGGPVRVHRPKEGGPPVVVLDRVAGGGVGAELAHWKERALTAEDELARLRAERRTG